MRVIFRQDLREIRHKRRDDGGIVMQRRNNRNETVSAGQG